MKNVLCGFFAFSRNSSKRNTADTLVPTLAYQLATYIHETKIYISDTSERATRCMIIDGLDECQDPKVQCNIIHSIVNNMSHLEFRCDFLFSVDPILKFGTHSKEWMDKPDQDIELINRTHDSSIFAQWPA
ncbi:hypothetical protein BDQ17DRAFT_1376657, partial [Cyathus striatus]